ncbi:MAG: hypothetical protein HWQ41_18485 [Nostoc sp. NOS(2021)]|uniref:hypothetical protein n=1 Tax=Nostoc sp. NOS(2021) TaxID=2815407 RepID=UPI0025F722DE|nr:hypothetical protein [Nostoc sp. NOS(2021)]MBN3897185.1 hypothetical protein [Nostoc sp. NOS(2021)]
MKDSEITSQSLELFTEIAEVVIDSLMEDGLLKDIPFISLAVKVANIGKTVSDRIFLTKVKKFLLYLDKVPVREKQSFLKTLDDEPEKKSKLGEYLVLIIDRIDDLDKTQILAELFLNLIKEKINLETFRRLASAVNIAFVEDLKKLIKNTKNSEDLGNLIGSGLTEVSSTGVILSGYDVVHNSVRISALGKLFVKLMNDKN